MIEYYKFRYGAEHTYWVHSLLKKMARVTNKYKFNYAVKAFLAYNVIAGYRNYRYVESMSFLTLKQRAVHLSPIINNSVIFAATCVLI
jgi:hypothetical protein